MRTWDSGIPASLQAVDVKNWVVFSKKKFMNVIVFRDVQHLTSGYLQISFRLLLHDPILISTFSYHFPQFKQNIFVLLCMFTTG